jgi:hypothetical protein
VAQEEPTSGPGPGAPGQQTGSTTAASDRRDDADAPAPQSGDDSGGGSAQFLGKGDNSVQELGSEAGESEFEQAASVLHAYLDARAAGRWTVACGYMEAGFRRSVEQLAGAEGQGSTGKPSAPQCGAALGALSGGPSAAAAKEAAEADAGALRVDGDRGVLLFHGIRHAGFFMPMALEAGRWKIAAFAASELR